MRRLVVPIALAAVLLLAVGAGATGLVVDPLRMTGPAQRGPVGRMTISNPSGSDIDVTVTPRRWQQSSDGSIAPDMSQGGVLGFIRVSDRSFKLRPKEKKIVSVAVRKVPKSGYLYASVTVRAEPARRAAGKPVYQVATSLHLEPTGSHRRARITVAPPRVTATRHVVSLSIRVRNRGTLVDPVGGKVTLTRGHTRRTVRVRAKGILPGNVLRLSSSRILGLKPGRYRVSATMTQQHTGATATGRTRFRLTRSGRITR